MRWPRPVVVALLLVALAALVALAWAPGLKGAFLFDDFANLPSIGASGPVTNWPAFWRYVTSGSADPIGRPLAMASFLLDARDWPAAPFGFKRTNLILHFACGLLLLQLLRTLGRMLAKPADRTRADLAAWLAAAFWLLHPLFVSTTLYVVQREAMLPALFTLAGLLLWLRGRRAFIDDRAKSGLLWTLLGLGVCTALATLSKANGVLLPALALVIEFAFLGAVAPLAAHSCTGRSRLSYRHTMFVLAGLPTAGVAGYLVYEGWHGLVHGISAVRPWTLAQRLMTEPRILFDYLGLLWLPRPFTPGLFNDHIHASISLWSPATTLPAIMGVLALIVGACLLRKRAPAIALAILFFFVGQSIESSTVALELYFEHRNYLPALLMFWPLALWLCDVPQCLPLRQRNGLRSPRTMSIRTRRWLKAGLAMVLLAGLAGMTHARASLWGDTHDQALLWARLNPASPRAQANAAQAEMASGHPGLAIARLRPALDRSPDEVQLALNLLGASCQLGDITPATKNAAIHALQTTRDTGALLAHWFERAIEQSRRPRCPQMGLATIEQLLDAALANPRLTSEPGRRQDLYHLLGQIDLVRSDADGALAQFNRALDQEVRAPAAFEQAALLGSAGYPAQGLAHLNHYESERAREEPPSAGMPRVHAWVLQREHYWDNELAHLRNTLLADARAKGTPGS